MATWDTGCSGCSRTHARRYHRHYGTTGHVWQGRFKAFPVQNDDHLVSVLRYVERNALRAELVSRAEDWKWSSLPGWFSGDAFLWRGDVVVRDERWLEGVNEPLSVGDLQRLRLSVERGQPYSEESWAKETARRLGLESTLRPRGRPRKIGDNLIQQWDVVTRGLTQWNPAGPSPGSSPIRPRRMPG